MTASLLVVEDDPVLQLSLTTILTQRGYTVVAARTLAEARAALAGPTPTIILVDLTLPDGNGLDLLAEQQSTEDAPLVIVVTGNETLATAVEAMRYGAFDYFTKPINFELLDAAIKRAVTYHEMRRTSREYDRLRAHEEAMQLTARSAAHYISQCLTIIMGEAQLLQEDTNDSNVVSGLDRIIAATQRAAETLTNLRLARRFVTTSSVTNEPMLDLNAAAQE